MGKKTTYKKNCTQVTIPTVDNSSPCDDFMYSECIIVNRRSSFVKNIPGDNLDEYHEKQENEILKLRNTVALLIKKVDALQACCGGSSGIGTFDEP